MAAKNPSMIRRKLNLNESPQKQRSGSRIPQPQKDVGPGAEGSVFPKLYELSFMKRFAQRFKEESALYDAQKSSRTPKCNRNSSRLSAMKTTLKIDEALKVHASSEGVFYKDDYLLVMLELELFRELKGKFYSVSQCFPSSLSTREKQEMAFLNLSWDFLTNKDSVQGQVLRDFIDVLLSPPPRVKAMSELSGVANTSSAGKVAKEFQILTQDQMAYNTNYPKKKLSTPQEYPYKPETCRRPQKSASQSSFSSRNEHLYSKQWEHGKKVTILKQKTIENELKDCTFSPATNKRPNSCTLEPRVKDKRPSEERALDLCSFTPTFMAKSPRKRDKGIPSGFVESIERLRKAFHEKQTQKEVHEKIPNGENYEKNKKSPANPPQFLKRDLKKNKRQILLYVDISIGNGKKGRIALHEDDNPKDLAMNFCKAFGLSADMQNNLEEMLKQQLLSALAELIE